MGKTKDGSAIKSHLIISEVQKRPCLFDSNHHNYGDRSEKSKCWDEVYSGVVPGWSALGQADKFTAGKEVQKRWRSIRDSYTKLYRQGKCIPPEQCTPGSRRYQYQKQMAFLLQALQNKKPRFSQDRYDSFSEVSSSPQHPTPDDVFPKIKPEIIDKPLDLKTRPEVPEKPETQDKGNQATITTERKNPSLEIKIDTNNILPDDHFDDDKLFMNSLIPLFKKMNDDTRLLCRIEVLKIMRYALQGNKSFEALRVAEDSFFRNRISGILAKEEFDTSKNDSVSVTTRSADGNRPVRKRKARSPSPQPPPIKKRGPGRPRKIRPPPSDSEEEKPRRVKLPVLPPELDEERYGSATRVDQLPEPAFMKMYNLERTRTPPMQTTATNQINIKKEPVEEQT